MNMTFLDGLVSKRTLQFACVASVPVRAERNIRHRSRCPILRSATTGTLATQATLQSALLITRQSGSVKTGYSRFLFAYTDQSHLVAAFQLNIRSGQDRSASNFSLILGYKHRGCRRQLTNLL